jgi:hypothetical protein
MMASMAKSKPLHEAELRPFRELAAAQQRLARKANQIFALEVDSIIRGQCRDEDRIEHLLDSLLGFCFDERVLLQFKKLGRYYYRINPAGTAEYVGIYREMWDENGEPDNE